MHIYDYIIIGSGLTGLTIAKKISQETENILVLEAHDFTGGDNRAAKLNDQVINNGLRFFPATEASLAAMEFLENVLGVSVATEKVESNPETYEAAGFKRFVGFGDKGFEFYNEISYFLSSEELPLQTPPYLWIQNLQESLQDKIQTKSIVTRFGFETPDGGKSQLTHVMVNGTKAVYARNFIFAGPVKDLGLLLPDEVLNLRAKAKLKKATAWQAVCLDLFHTSTIEKNNLFVLNGTTDDELGPCIGRFLPQLDPTAGAHAPAAEGAGQISQWLSFIDFEVAEDTENIGLVLKKMKRQIKRAFPEIADTIKKERIFVTTPLSGVDLKLTASLTVPGVSNLWIASPQVSKSKNLLASLQQAQIVLAAMGFNTGIDLASATETSVDGEISAEDEEMKRTAARSLILVLSKEHPMKMPLRI